MKMSQVQHGHGIELQPGMTIAGKWNDQHYTIKRKLGSGTVGAVYLCVHHGKEVALKISEQNSSITVEVNVLKALNRVQGACLGPDLFDVDDWKATESTIYSFYVMEYIKGESLRTFVKWNGSEWIGVFMLQLLNHLEDLHQSGWVFGDLKTDNLLIMSSPPQVRWVDVGGTTQMGRAIKEYTEFYDRGYWSMGTRRAEPSYDLFSFVMVFLTLFYPQQFPRSADPKQMIINKINDVREFALYKPILKKAIIGSYQSSASMKQELIGLLQEQKSRGASDRPVQRPKLVALFIESGGILCLATTYYLISLLI